MWFFQVSFKIHIDFFIYVWAYPKGITGPYPIIALANNTATEKLLASLDFIFSHSNNTWQIKKGSWIVTGTMIHGQLSWEFKQTIYIVRVQNEGEGCSVITCSCEPNQCCQLWVWDTWQKSNCVTQFLYAYIQCCYFSTISIPSCLLAFPLECTHTQQLSLAISLLGLLSHLPPQSTLYSLHPLTSVTLPNLLIWLSLFSPYLKFSCNTSYTPRLSVLPYWILLP